VEEIMITPDMRSVPPVSIVISGSGNDDDDLDDVVGRWDSAGPQSEAEITDRQYRGGHDHESDSAVGDDSL